MTALPAAPPARLYVHLTKPLSLGMRAALRDLARGPLVDVGGAFAPPDADRRSRFHLAQSVRALADRRLAAIRDTIEAGERIREAAITDAGRDHAERL